MMDLSSVIDAGLVVVGVVWVLLMGLWTLSSESSTVSTSPNHRRQRSGINATMLRGPMLRESLVRRIHRQRRGSPFRGLPLPHKENSVCSCSRAADARRLWVFPECPLLL